jgi:hypothetical protein
MLSHFIQIPDVVLEGDPFGFDRGGLPTAAWIVENDAATFGENFKFLGPTHERNHNGFALPNRSKVEPNTRFNFDKSFLGRRHANQRALACAV